MTERKRCVSCGKYLIRFQKHYLHPYTPCSGIKDSIYIEAIISDETLHDKFVEMYGTPDMDDSEHVDILEKQVMDLNTKLNHPFIKFITKFIK